jgi:hypothetical protein
MNTIKARPPQLAEGTVSEHQKNPSRLPRGPVTNVYRRHRGERRFFRYQKRYKALWLRGIGLFGNCFRVVNNGPGTLYSAIDRKVGSILDSTFDARFSWAHTVTRRRSDVKLW